MIRVRFEVKAEYLWVGAFWRWTGPYYDESAARALARIGQLGPFGGGRLDVWICVLPCVPLHLTIGPGDPPDEPRWHCRCGRNNVPAWRDECDGCRQRQPGLDSGGSQP